MATENSNRVSDLMAHIKALVEAKDYEGVVAYVNQQEPEIRDQLVAWSNQLLDDAQNVDRSQEAGAPEQPADNPEPRQLSPNRGESLVPGKGTGLGLLAKPELPFGEDDDYGGRVTHEEIPPLDAGAPATPTGDGFEIAFPFGARLTMVPQLLGWQKTGPDEDWTIMTIADMIEHNPQRLADDFSVEVDGEPTEESPWRGLRWTADIPRLYGIPQEPE